MNEKYLTFENFSKEDIKNFIKTFPREILLIPICKESEFKNHVGVKGFRPESIRSNVLQSIYVNEIVSNPNGFLAIHILKTLDAIIEEELDHEEYLALKNDTCDEESLHKILDKLVDADLIEEEFLFKFLRNKDIDENQYIVKSLQKQLQESIVEKENLQKEIKNQKTEQQNLMEKNKVLENNLQKYKKNYIKKEEYQKLIKEKQELQYTMDTLQEQMKNTIEKQKMIVLQEENESLRKNIQEQEKKLNKLQFVQQENENLKQFIGKCETMLQEQKDIQIKKILDEWLMNLENIGYHQLSKLSERMKIQEDIPMMLQQVYSLKQEMLEIGDFQTYEALILTEYLMIRIGGIMYHE